jgi:predicted  nucleic acid-binding Zn-ribbon protein
MDTSLHAHTPSVPEGLDATADDVMSAAAATPVADDPLDAILRQIVGGYFVLTDGQGSVSKWSEPAELLFGRPAAEVLGQSFFQTLVNGPLPAGAEAWRRFLESGEPPQAPGRSEVTGLHADGTTFAMDIVFVPVKLDEGFDFSLFLEDLGFELPLNLMLLRMRQQHPVVVRALHQALEPEPQPWEGWRTAGTLVVFRPLAATPWVQAELEAREAARAEADAEVEERLTTLDPGIQGNSVADLDDAAAVVARLLSAVERIDELERFALGLPSQLEEARQHAERRAEAAEREAQAVRAEHEEAAQAARRELAETVERLERVQREESAGLRGELAELRDAAPDPSEIHARLDAADLPALRERLDAVQAAAAGLDALRAEVGALGVDALRAEVGELGVEALRDEMATLRDGAAEVGTLRSELAALRERAAQADEVETLRSRQDEILADLTAAREAIEARVDEAGRQSADAVRDLDERIAEVDRGAGAVLSDVRVLRDGLDELSTVARSAQEEANGAREQAAAAGEAAAAARTEARTAAEETADRLADVDTRAQALRTEMTAGRERLDALGSRVERLGEDLAEADQVARDAAEAQAAELREELAAARRVAQEARDGLEALRSDVETVRRQSQGVADDAASARAAAEGGERRVEAMQAELTYALKTLEELKAGLTSAGQAAVIARREAEQAKRAAQTVGEGNSGVHEVFQQLLGMAAARGGSGGAGGRRPLSSGSEVRRKPQVAQREPRHGFDDVSQPLAILGPDGRFRELNPSFARLVGYQEHEFAKAAWPSPHDRAVYQQQQEQLRQLVSGEIASVSVQSTYMHGQGLMVPILGTLTVVPGEDGLPLHLLLEAEEKHGG